MTINDTIKHLTKTIEKYYENVSINTNVKIKKGNLHILLWEINWGKDPDYHIKLFELNDIDTIIKEKFNLKIHNIFIGGSTFYLELVNDESNAE